MGLQDLNEDIYRRDYADGRESHTEYDPGNPDAKGDVRFKSDTWGVNETPVKTSTFSKIGEFFATKWKWVIVALSSIIFLVFLANLTVISEMLFTDDRIGISVVGPSEVASAETVEYTLRYDNGNILPADDVSITLTFPDSFRIEKGEGMSIQGNTATLPVGEVGGRSYGEAKFSGKFYGSKGTRIYLKATFGFSPSGMSSRFEKNTQYDVTIASSPLVLEAIAPKEIASGNEVEYVISYRNESDLPFSNLRVKAEYPDGFRFNQSEPKSTEGDSLWRIGDLLPHASGEIRVKGILTGSRDQAKVLRASLGVLQGDGMLVAYDEKERTTRIVMSPLTITQTVNGKTDLSVSPGDMLKYELKYMNEGTIGLRDVIITLEMNASLLDMTRLILRGGSYDTARNVITWRASDLPELARLEPNRGGTVAFSVPVRGDIAVNTEAGKHLSIRTLAKIDSLDIPFSSPNNKVISSNMLDVRIGSVVDFQINGFYFDAALPNSGPLPPKVGQETTYTLRFKVTNFLNDISKAKVSMLVPTSVRYTGKRSPDSESISYNDRTGQLTWDIGSILGGGESSREVALQFSITPSPNQAGNAAQLLTNAVFEAEDVFTKEPIRIERGSKTTSLPEDKSIATTGHIVVP